MYFYGLLKKTKTMNNWLLVAIAICICMTSCNGLDDDVTDDVITEFVVSSDMLDVDFEEMAIDEKELKKNKRE